MTEEVRCQLVKCFALNKYDLPLIWSYCLGIGAMLCDYRVSAWPSRACSPVPAHQREYRSSVKRQAIKDM